MKKAAQFVLALLILALGYVLYDQIATPIRFDKERKMREEAVIARLKEIRTAQRAYKSKYQHFTGSFDTLVQFILTDSLVGERKLVDEDDSVGLAMLKRRGLKNIETFTVAVRDTIFSPHRLSAEQIRSLPHIPGAGQGTQFLLQAGMAQASGVTVPVVECKAPYKSFIDSVRFRQELINLIDERKNVYEKYPGLMFGDINAANNEAGNWEN